MRNLFFILALIILTIGVYAQEYKIEKKKSSSIFIDPSCLINLFNPALQIGFQQDLSKKYILQIECGMILKHSIFGYAGMHLTPQSKNFDYSGYKLQAEIKRIIFEKRRHVIRKSYLAGELLYLKNRGNVNEYGWDDNGEINYDFFIQEKHKYRLSVKFGMNFGIGNHFLVDWSVGIGAAYYQTKYFNRDFSIFTDYTYFDVFRPGNYFKLNFPIGVKLGYRF